MGLGKTSPLLKIKWSVPNRQGVDRIIPDENWKRSRIVMFNDITDLIFGLGQAPKCGGMTPVNETPSSILII